MFRLFMILIGYGLPLLNKKMILEELGTLDVESLGVLFDDLITEILLR